MSVTYKIITIPGLSAGETGYQLSDGSYAAVSFAAGLGAAPDMFSIMATARAVTPDGAPILDHTNQPIICRKHASAPKSSLVTGATSGTDVRDEGLEEVFNGHDGLVAELAAVKAYKAALT